ncbi:MAG: protein BatD [Alistipes sp.]|nr:protein BatD [Alistipes sp.]
MSILKRVFLTVTAVLCACMAARADEDVSFDVNVKMIVAAGEAFKVEFVLNADPEKNSFTPPDFGDFDILAGPATSTGHSVQFINGSMSKSVSYTITYVLLPRSSGTFTIGAAAIRSGGKRYTTNPTQIEVKEGGSDASQPAAQGRNDRQSLESQAEGQIGSEDLLLKLNLSRTGVYTGEPLLASLKLYNRVNLADYAVQKMPSFNGFWTQQLESDSRPHRETYNGKVYEVYTLIEYLLYPQQSGTLTIDPVELTAVVQVIVQNNSNNFDPFFGGGREIYNVRRALATPKLTVNVKELPAGAPAGFSGAVGRFTMEAAPSAAEMAANSAATYTVKISGAGNLAFIPAPKLNMPSSFEVYPVKTTEQLRSTGSGTTGSRTFEYPFIARAEGEYTIQPAEFSYFNPERGQYVTLTSAVSTLQITPDAGGSSAAPQVISGPAKEDVRMLGNDIRFIKLGKAGLKKSSEPEILGIRYFIILLSLLGAATAAGIIVSQRRRENKNVALMRGKRANKVAVQRFRNAEKHMKAENRHAFYEEMLKALWGYISDKFNIPVADLTKENVREELHKHGISAETAQQFIAVISKCDEAQYAPAASSQMNEVYAEGIDIVSQIEAMIKK